MKDNVNHPEHYTQHPSGVECIDITRHYCFSIGNAIKYLWRAGLKKEEGLDDKQKEIEDLKKAIWYISDRIKQLEMDNATNKFQGKTTWEGFQRPFKDGDIISNGNTIAIFKKADKPYIYFKKDVVYYHCFYSHKYNEFRAKIDFGIGHVEEFKYATEEEKQKLFDAIKANGYKWNAETKTLEKLVEPKFKVGDIIQDIDTYKVKITEVNMYDECYIYESIIAKGIGSITFSEQNNWELVPSKFDITTLKPFDKVLVRVCDADKWDGDFYMWYDNTQKEFPYYCVNSVWSQCIPYENNEHLLGTTNNCDEFYKTWE